MKPRGSVDGLVFLAAVDQLVSRGASDAWVERKAGLADNQIYRVRSGRTQRVYRRTFEAVLALRDDVRDGRVKLPKPHRLQHGTRSCYVSGCRLLSCVRAARDYQRAHAEALRRHRGMPDSFVDGDVARALILAYMSNGWSEKALAAAAGIDRVQVWRIRERTPRRVKRETFERLHRAPSSPWADRRAS